jgi:hypothetical protein
MKKTTKKSKTPVKKQKKIKAENISSLKSDIDEKDKEKADTYEEHACEYLNEAECEEELEDDGLDIDDVEKSHFGDDVE